MRDIIFGVISLCLITSVTGYLGSAMQKKGQLSPDGGIRLPNLAPLFYAVAAFATLALAWVISVLPEEDIYDRIILIFIIVVMDAVLILISLPFLLRAVWFRDDRIEIRNSFGKRHSITYEEITECRRTGKGSLILYNHGRKILKLDETMPLEEAEDQLRKHGIEILPCP